MRDVIRGLFAAVAFLVIGAGQASAATIDFAAVGNISGILSITVSGLKATETLGGTLVLETGAGLGVVGGSTPFTDEIINLNESVRFDFLAGPATSVGFTRISGSTIFATPNFNIEGFGLSGTSLGTVTADFTFLLSYNVSGAFGDVPLTAFRLYGNGSDTGIAVGTVSFTPDSRTVPGVVPEPASLTLLGLGLAGASARRWRQRRNQ